MARELTLHIHPATTLQRIPYFSKAVVAERPCSISRRTIFSALAFSKAPVITESIKAAGTTSTPSMSPKTRSPGRMETCPISIGQAEVDHLHADAGVLGIATAAESGKFLLEDSGRVTVEAVLSDASQRRWEMANASVSSNRWFSPPMPQAKE